MSYHDQIPLRIRHLPIYVEPALNATHAYDLLIYVEPGLEFDESSTDDVISS